jgi:Ca2+-binding RTX toxin-like protein
METQNNILLDDILLINADPQIKILSDEKDDSSIKNLSDEKSLEKDDSYIKNLSDKKSSEKDDSHLKNLSDEKTLENKEDFILSPEIGSLLIETKPTDTVLDLSGAIVQAPSSLETDLTDLDLIDTGFDFSNLFAEAPPPQTPNTGNDTIIGGYSPFIFGDDNPNNLSAASSFVQTYIWGFGGNDTLTGGFSSDILDGGAGDDWLNGGLGDDLLRGSDGNDTLDGGYGYDTLDGGNGTDTATYKFWWGGIKANLQTETVTFFNDPGNGTEYLRSIENVVGSNGNDEIIGNSADNVLYGENGNDLLSGEDGNDILLGGDGDDTLITSSGYDQLDGGAGYDIAQIVGDGDIVFEQNWGNVGNISYTSKTGSYNAVLSNIEQVQLIGGNNDDFILAVQAPVALKLEGRGGDDILLGGAFGNTLEGGAGNDILRGNNGNDILQGSDNSNSVEKDTLLGGLGADTFVLGTSNGGAFYIGDGFAIIQDFKWWEGDKIQVVGNISDYRLDTTQNLIGNSALDTAIYRGDDLIAIAQDMVGIIPIFDFKVV